MLNKKIGISCFVVSNNEGYLLEKCLASVSFCEDIIVVDLNSTDNTKDIALNHGCRYMKINPIPILEAIHKKHLEQCKFNWVMLLDPDEVVTSSLKNSLIEFFQNPGDSDSVAIVNVPILYFFKGKLLKYTKWSGVKHKKFVINKERVILNDGVHRGVSLVSPFKIHDISFDGGNYIKHFWMHSYKQLIDKHLRYLKNEGVSRYNLGKRTSFLKIFYVFIKEFKENYINHRGYRGLFLSLFRAWYFSSAEIMLLIQQHKQNRCN